MVPYCYQSKQGPCVQSYYGQKYTITKLWDKILNMYSVYMHIGCMNKLTDFWSSIEAANKVRCDIIVTDKAGRSEVTEL